MAKPVRRETDMRKLFEEQNMIVQPEENSSRFVPGDFGTQEDFEEAKARVTSVPAPAKENKAAAVSSEKREGQSPKKAEKKPQKPKSKKSASFDPDAASSRRASAAMIEEMMFSETQFINIRIKTSLLQSIDEYKDWLSKKAGTKISRNYVIEHILSDFFDGEPSEETEEDS